MQHRHVRAGRIAGALGLAAAMLVSGGCDRPATLADAAGAAPSRNQPPAEATVFSDGGISDANEQWRITFTPDGKTAYFAESPFFFPATRQAFIYVSHLEDGAWTAPELAPFSGQYSDMDPFLSPDGQRLYFSSIRPVDGQPRADMELWMVERTPSGWSEPIHLGPEVNSPEDELYASASADGTLYWASGPLFPQPGKHFDIYRAERQGDGFASREALGDAVNRVPADYPGGGLQDAWEFNPKISVDGHTLVFTSLRPGGYGLGDLYVSHLRGGEWSAAQNLGPAVNSAMDEYHPTLSRDRRTLYFIRRIFRPEPFLFVRGNFYEIATASLDAFDRP
jgi:Tol biopolymer transport system component